jgi:DNA-binding GntR family transcriptional regulator
MSSELSQRVYDHLCKKLLAGELRGGDRLYEVAIAKETGVSRSPVREAMVRMRAEGLLDHVPKLGAFVQTPSPGELAQLFAKRQWLESGAAASLAQLPAPQHQAKPAGNANATMGPTPGGATGGVLGNASAPSAQANGRGTGNMTAGTGDDGAPGTSLPEDPLVANLQRLHDQTLALAREFYAENRDVASAGLADRLLRLDGAFHIALFEALGNDVGLKSLVRTLMLIQIAAPRSAIVANREYVARIYTDHDLVLRAVRRRDVTGAWKAMWDHIGWTTFIALGPTSQSSAAQQPPTAAAATAAARRAGEDWPEPMRTLLRSGLGTVPAMQAPKAAIPRQAIVR